MLQLEKFKRWTGVIRKKATVIGPVGGKTALIRTFAEKKYPPESFFLTIFENFVADLDIGCTLELAIWDTPGVDHYKGLRQLSYPDTDLFLLCFDIARSDLLSDIEDVSSRQYILTGESQWKPEVRKDYPKTPMVLVGCRKDVRDCRPGFNVLTSGGDPVSWATGEAVARKIGAAMYMEFSAKTGEGVEAVFNEPFKVMFPDKVKKSWRRKLLLGA